MPLEDRPPGDIEKNSLVGLTPREISVTSYSDAPLAAKKPASEVLLVFNAEELPIKLAIRFRGPGMLDDVIEALQKHRAHVWGARHA